jgi:hypothetical protein
MMHLTFHWWNVGSWHIADNRGTATICPLSDKSGHCSAAVLISTATLPLPLRKFPELPGLLRTIIFGGMKPDLFRDLPEDCTCDGEGLAPVSRVPRVGAMPELVTYRCEACGHVETVEAQPKEQR